MRVVRGNQKEDVKLARVVEGERGARQVAPHSALALISVRTTPDAEKTAAGNGRDDGQVPSAVILELVIASDKESAGCRAPGCRELRPGKLKL